jgi:putative MFS transporter
VSARMAEPFTPYQRRLFLFLGVATFFEGYDFLALSQILPELREEFQLAPAWSGRIVGLVNVGSIFAYFLVRLADDWGRKRVLTLTIAGYTLFTFASGLAPNVYAFIALQLLSRIFLLAEWAISMVIAAEEFPASRRGFVIGCITGINGIGAIVCALLVPVLTRLAPSLGFRLVYFVAVVPLLVLAFARRGLRETARFEAQAEKTEKRSLFHIFRTPRFGSSRTSPRRTPSRSGRSTPSTGSVSRTRRSVSPSRSRRVRPCPSSSAWASSSIASAGSPRRPSST